MTDADRWRAVADLFDRAIDQPAASRAAFVHAEAADRRDVADEVLSLLAAHDRGAAVLESAIAGATPAPAPATRLAPGDRVGHYAIAGLLGEGGMGIVYLAHDTRLDRPLALKAVAPAYASDPASIARLRREARAAAALNHPAIATVYALEEIDGRLFIGSEYVPGETLRDEGARGPLPPADVARTAAALARALAAAHATGVVHRDLKPENIMRLPDGGVKILDFGLARSARDRDASVLTTSGTFGTPAYMSPEQIRGEAVDGRTDLFSLGTVLFELLTGVHPFAAPTAAGTLARILQDAAPDVRPALPPGSRDDPRVDVLAAVIARCLRKAPADRFTHALEIAEIVEGTRAARRDARARPVERRGLWWWHVHQTLAIAAYAALLVPLWRMRHATPTRAGVIWFLTALAAVTAAGALRLHAWFSVRTLAPATAPSRLTRVWTRVSDAAFATALLGAGIADATVDDGAAGLCVAAAVAVTVASFVVEPATTRAAFGGNRRDDPPLPR